MKTLYDWQKRFLEKNPERALLLAETGTGKTVAACEWIKLRPRKKSLVLCPKSIVGKWERDLKEWGAKADVVSMSQMNKVNLDAYSSLILDEAQHYASPLFASGRSKRTEVIYGYVRKHPEAHILLLSATPIRSTPWNAHTLGAYIGHYWDHRVFRKTFFVFTDMFGRWHWEPKRDWRIQIRPYIERISDIVLLRECADIPKQTEEIVRVPWTNEDEKDLSHEYMEPSKEWHTRHRAENKRKKFDTVISLAEGYRKVIVVCNYTEQIDDFVRWVGDERQVYVLDGRTKDQDATIEAAKRADDCVFVVQSSMGAGFDAAEFSVVIFASMDFKYISMVQMKGRVLRINNLHENKFYFVLGGQCDQRVYETVMSGHDFNPHMYMQEGYKNQGTGR